MVKNRQLLLVVGRNSKMYTIMPGHHTATPFLRSLHLETFQFRDAILPFGAIRVNTTQHEHVFKPPYLLTLILSLSKESYVSVFGQVLRTERWYD